MSGMQASYLHINAKFERFGMARFYFILFHCVFPRGKFLLSLFYLRSGFHFATMLARKQSCHVLGTPENVCISDLYRYATEEESYPGAASAYMTNNFT